MFCSKCGTEVKDGALFCQGCGAKLNVNSQSPAAPTEISPSSVTNSAAVCCPSKPSEQPPLPLNKRVYKPHPNAYINPPKTKIPVSEIPNNGSVGFAEAIKLFFVNCVDFSGRASKSEYLWSCLFTVLSGITIGFTIFIPFIGIIIAGISFLLLAVPSISVTVRRLHDIGKPGIWCFLILVPFGIIALIVFCCRDSVGDNQWGKCTVGVGNYGNATSSSVNIATAQRVMSDNDIFVIAENHEPFDLGTPEAKKYLDGVLSKVFPAYTGAENLADVIELSDPQDISNNLAVTDTDSLAVIVKALGYYISEGADENILGAVQREAVFILKTRF